MTYSVFQSQLMIRGQDAHGNGGFGSPRGEGRTHKGIDICAYPGSGIYPIVPGRVSKLGFPYADDLAFRYVQITWSNIHYRYFYIEPLVDLGEWVDPQTIIGTVQDLTERYPGITNHFHFSIKDVMTGARLDPTRLVMRT
jgi:murein DD-endopeptidase MepM/ murein hydrolase activator NlpD